MLDDGGDGVCICAACDVAGGEPPYGGLWLGFWRMDVCVCVCMANGERVYVYAFVSVSMVG